MMYAYSVSTKRSLVVAVVALVVVISGQRSYAQPPNGFLSYQKISSTQGGGPPLDIDDQFSISVASRADINGDGVDDLALGAHRDDDGGFNHGAVWILYLNSDDTTITTRKSANRCVGLIVTYS